MDMTEQNVLHIFFVFDALLSSHLNKTLYRFAYFLLNDNTFDKMLYIEYRFIGLLQNLLYAKKISKQLL